MPRTKKNNTISISSSNKKTIKISKKSTTKYIEQKNNKIQQKDEKKSFEDLNIFRPPNNPNKVHPKIWELPNRKHFYNWVMDTFQQYELGNTKKQKREIPRIKERLELNNIQRLTFIYWIRCWQNLRCNYYFRSHSY